MNPLAFGIALSIGTLPLLTPLLFAFPNWFSLFVPPTAGTYGAAAVLSIIIYLSLVVAAVARFTRINRRKSFHGIILAVCTIGGSLVLTRLMLPIPVAFALLLTDERANNVNGFIIGLIVFSAVFVACSITAIRGCIKPEHVRVNNEFVSDISERR